MNLDDITAAIVDAAIKTHIDPVSGLLESVYETVLPRALQRRGFEVERQKVIQFLTCLRPMKLHVGLLINFGTATLKEGRHRIVNNLPSPASPYLRVNQSEV
ncbi:MAG: GxxExxY protein [Gallionella sp.]|nr:GxxExxY protein [Gallionella sp.]